MKSIDKLILEMEVSLGQMCDLIGSLKKDLRESRKEWSLWGEHQVCKTDEWYSRYIDPPKGKIWASDGVNAWIINHSGGPIPKHATKVLYWTAAFIPAPPWGGETYNYEGSDKEE